MPFGWQAPWPLQWGGGPTPVEQALSALLSGVGKGHAADVDGVERRWREARAVGIAAAMTMAERALMQFSPVTATSALPFYEELFALYGLSDQQIRERAQLLDMATDDFGVGDVERQLQQIDLSFSILNKPWGAIDTTVVGSAFETDGAPFHFATGAKETLYPNVSSAFVVNVAYDLSGAAPVGFSSQNSLMAARALLDDALPAWVDYEIGGTSGGFILDASFLDWDRFDP